MSQEFTGGGRRAQVDRKPAPTPTAVATTGARGAVGLDIADGDPQYAANMGNTVHLSAICDPPRRTNGCSEARLSSTPEIKSMESRLFCPPPLDVLGEKC